MTLHDLAARCESARGPSCIECGKLTTLVDGSRIYPHRADLYSKNYWLCECGAYCGCHGTTTQPLGYPCGPETRKARSEAHTAFDQLWKSGLMRRASAYKALAEALGMSHRDCHIGMMDAATARRVPEIAAALRARAQIEGQEA